MFFKNKLEIYSNRIPINFLKDFIVTYPKNLPYYFKNIPKTCPFKIGNNFNIRTCSGFINYFRRSILFKSPFDILITLQNNQIFCNFGSGVYNNDRNIVAHSANQFLQYIDNNKYEVIIKLIFGINLKSKIPITMNSSWWHFNDFEVIPGVLNAKIPTELNLFIPIKKGVSEIRIKQNTPLCTLHLESDRKVKVIFKDDKINTKDYNGLEYLKSNLKNKILDNKHEF